MMMMMMTLTMTMMMMIVVFVVVVMTMLTVYFPCFQKFYRQLYLQPVTPSLNTFSKICYQTFSATVYLASSHGFIDNRIFRSQR
jgi:hypothetical protein